MKTLFTDNFPTVTSDKKLDVLKTQYPTYDPYYIASGCKKERREKFDKFMENKIDYSLIDDSDSVNRDVKKLKCIINENKKVIFEFSEEVLRDVDCLNLNKNLSAKELYEKIENFLICELDNNRLKDKYLIRTNNFSQYCL